jgi:secernin
MCDTLCVLGDKTTLFAKNSDRPVTEAQLIEAHPRRAGGGRLRTQYLELPDSGAFATLLSRPDWLWGAEHGVNEHGVAIGNELVNTVDDPRAAPPALLGMDLVRLGLERGVTAEDALDIMTTLLERHGQGGVGDAVNGVAYWSSFLVADPSSAFVLETSGRSWAARPVEGGGAISNRLTLRRDWTRASPDVVPGTDLDSWRDPGTPTGFADGRLASSRAFVERSIATAVLSHPSPSPSAAARAAVAHLRDHGTGPWGAPGDDGSLEVAPTEVLADGTGVTVCMHIRDFEATTASMVAELSVDDARPARAWVSLGNPCASVFVPVLAASPGSPEPIVPGTLAQGSSARRFAALSRVAERDGGSLETVRAVLAPVEAALWDEADTLNADVATWRAFRLHAEQQVVGALDTLARAGVGLPATA